MKKRYKHIFFDLDHTLWDYEKNAAQTILQIYHEFERFLPPHAGPQEFYQRFRVHNKALWTLFQQGKIQREELHWKRFWLTLLDYGYADKDLSRNLHHAYMDRLPFQPHLIPFAREVLAYCSRYYCLHLITNGFDATQRQKLKTSGIEATFQHVISSETSMSRKPRPEIYAYAEALTGAHAQDSLMVGDGYEVDIMGARNAGWDQVYYNPEKRSHGQNPTMEIHSLEELMKLL